jgi:ParB family chromosome partitioning protein
VPAIVTQATRQELLLRGLAENVARRSYKAGHFARELTALRERGCAAAEIARRTGREPAYVAGLIELIDRGEARLVAAVERGCIAADLAVEVAACADERAVGRLMAAAHESGRLRGRALLRARHVVQQRRDVGRDLTRARPRRRPAEAGREDAAARVARCRRELARRAGILRQAAICRDRLRGIRAAFDALFTDEALVHLLRGESMDAVPQFLTEADGHRPGPNRGRAEQGAETAIGAAPDDDAAGAASPDGDQLAAAGHGTKEAP